MSWIYLLGAVVTEVCGTLTLRMAAVTGRQRWNLFTAVLYVAAFSLLSASLAAGMLLGVAYGLWAALGVALTAVLSWALFGESLNKVKVLGLILIIGGVLLVETAAG